MYVLANAATAVCGGGGGGGGGSVAIATAVRDNTTSVLFDHFPVWFSGGCDDDGGPLF